MKPFLRARSGRDGYFAVWNHYLGPSNVDNCANEAERTLERAQYSGEKRRWNFERYVSLHKRQHQILEDLKQLGHAGIDPRSKVRHLLNGIKTDKLDVVKSQILASTALHNDFDACVTLFKDFIQQTTGSINPTWNVSAAKTSKRAHWEDQEADNDLEVKVRYYTKEEYKKLTPAQKLKLKKLRTQQDGRAKGKAFNRSGGGKHPKNAIASIKADVKAMSSQISALMELRRQDQPLSSDKDGTHVSQELTNRTNPALKRSKNSQQMSAVVTQSTHKHCILSNLKVDEVRCELDSHADTCVVGKNALIFQDFGRPVSVSAYDPSLGTKPGMKVVSAAIAYDDPTNGEVKILVIHQAIYILTLDHNLLSPMQMRLNEVVVNDCPSFLNPKPHDLSHSIKIPGPDGDVVVIPLRLFGVTSYFPCRRPTQQEFETGDKFDLTAETAEWDPYDSTFARQESHHQNTQDWELDSGDRLRQARSFISSFDSLEPNTQYQAVGKLSSKSNQVLMKIDPNLDGYTFAMRLNKRHNVSLASSTREKPISAEALAKNWGVSIEVAKKTRAATTQRGVRFITPSMSKPYRTNDRMLRYRRLRVDMFTDTMFSDVTSKRGNKCAQIYCTNFGWVRAYPMKKKSQAHETFSNLCSTIGVPSALIMDGAREQIMGEFRCKAKEVDCRMKPLEPYTPWANAAESAIRELKKSTGHKMIATKTPKKLWDDCLECEAIIRSHTAHGIYDLEDEVPETLVTGETPDI